MELIEIKDLNSDAWNDMICGFSTSAIFHTSHWLDFVEKTQKGIRVILKIREKNDTIGYFVGVIIKKGPFSILGSPLTGWTTQFMGPVVRDSFPQELFLDALETYCRSVGIHQIELSAPILRPDILLKHRFKCRRDVTPIVNLSVDEQVMWKKLKSKSCRYEIRKALKKGVRVEETDDPKIIDRFYDQLIEVFAKQSLVPTYGRDRVKYLFECLKPKDMLICLEAKYKKKVIGTALFPHDDHWVYYWGGASDFAHRALSPNELIQWTLMKIAAKRGIGKYDMYGGDNRFKLKFGAEVKDVYFWVKSFNPLAGFARDSYQQLFNVRQRVTGSLKRLHRTKIQDG
jgi:hypothetical protein